MPIFLIRHARTRLNKGNQNAEDRIRGWLQIPLSPEGREESKRIAKSLVGLGIEKLMCSDLDRAVETAQAISDELGIPISKRSKDFRPWNLGEFQGEPTKEVIPKIHDYAEHRPDEIVPGGESFTTFCCRLTKALRFLMEQHKQNKLSTTAVVTHYRDLKLAEGWIGGKGNRAKMLRIFFTDNTPTGAILKIFPVKDGWDYKLIIGKK